MTTEEEILDANFADLADLADTNKIIPKMKQITQKIIHEARLAALDDCKALLGRVLSETYRWQSGTNADCISRIRLIMDAELEALKTSFPKEVLSRNAKD